MIDPALHWGDDERAASAEFDILGSPTEGTFAERVVVPAANVHPKPPALSWEEAAAFPLAGLTAWRATVTCAGAAPGRRLLITGGGSGVSTFCLQIAHALGAEVWVTSGSDAKIARCVELGARGGFRYDDPDWPRQVRAATGGEGVHAVIDSFGGAGWEQALAALARGGVLVNYGDTGGDEATIPVAALLLAVALADRHDDGQPAGVPRPVRARRRRAPGARPSTPCIRWRRWTPPPAASPAPERFGKVVLRIG